MIAEIKVKSVLNRHKRRDSWFLDDYSLNPYSGCSFGCIYCYTRGSKYGRARGLAVKINAAELLERQLRARAERGEYGIISLSSATEPYMEVEKELRLTRRLLEIILKYRFPVEVATKSKLVLRDLDLLREIDRQAILPKDLKHSLGRGALVLFSLSTLDAELAGLLEPAAPPPLERLETMRRCREEGLLTGLCLMPVLPFLSDSPQQLEQAVKAAKEYGAEFFLAGALTLFGSSPADSRTLYFKFLRRHYPELLPGYRDLYGNSFQPGKSYLKELERRVKGLCEKYGIRNSII